MDPINRRELIAAAAVACACVLCPIPAWADGANKSPVDIGPLSDFNQDGMWDQWASSGFVIVHAHGTLVALSARCPHQGGIVRIDPQDRGILKCVRHGARFDARGDVTRGPARQGLQFLGITVNGNGHVMVDPSRRFDHDHGDTPGASVRA